MNNSIYSSNVYIGVSPRMRIHEKEIDAAKRHIAHQIAVRDNCIVDLRRMRIFASKEDIIYSDSYFDYDDPYIDELLERIEVINIYEFKEIILVVGRDSSKPSIANTPILRKAAERPKWVSNPEWIRDLFGQGYYVGIGIAEKYRMYYRGIFFADIGAAQAIASEKETHIHIYMIDTEENKNSYIESGTLTLTENVEMEGFYILDRWIEPDGLTYYSLGIASKRVIK